MRHAYARAFYLFTFLLFPLFNYLKKIQIIPRSMANYPQKYGKLSPEVWQIIPRSMANYPPDNLGNIDFCHKYTYAKKSSQA